nr:hypothetical protein [Tanacetum cinerariifolium]
GKFKAKGDEGYFIGYSMSSKAFRVFNKRTKKVEENLHVEFLENNAIEKGVRPIGTKWVIKNKKDERGIVIRNKVRLVAQGHTQEEVYQMDVKSAFLYGTIDEEVYVMQPPRFQDPKGTIDQTLFIRRQRGDFILVQVYMEDIIFGSSNPQLCREFEALMHEKFQMSAMGELNLFLGL